MRTTLFTTLILLAIGLQASSPRSELAARASSLHTDVAARASSLHTQHAADIGRMLDDFHDAAAKADGDRYFAHFAEGAVFLGTDPTERWTVEEFRAWSAPYFERDSAWTYHAISRHVQIDDSGAVGWFDEVVRNETYGDLRGTGVVLLQNGKWKLAQYNLTFLIPNDDAAKVLEIIKHD